MTFIILLLLIGAGVVVFFVLNSARESPMTLSARMGRFGLAVPADGDMGGPTGPVIAPARERQQQSAVSESVENIVGRGRFGKAIFNRLDRAEIKMTAG